ncbi:MAG TPA: hypothetical protein VEJ86_08845 [Candidatus Binataceae bacterium]|nr:hypothetical protein [Candidatus Binataceae bacterium]
MIVRRTITGVLLAAALAPAGANAADLKSVGSLQIPSGAQIMTVCTDPVVQRTLSDELSGSAPSSIAANQAPTVTVTVTVSERTLSPGASLADVAPGDPEVADLLKDLGAQPPPLGDSGDKRSDPYAEAARQRALNANDPLTQDFRDYQAYRQSLDPARAPTPYDNIPKNQIYDTVLVARATMMGSADQIEVVTLLHPGDDLRRAKEQVAVRIADSLLH